MDLIIYIFEHIIEFWIASVPLIFVFLFSKFFKLSYKRILVCLLLNMLVSVFFWIKLRDVQIVLYQGIPYVLSFIIVWAESVFEKRNKEK